MKRRLKILYILFRILDYFELANKILLKDFFKSLELDKRTDYSAKYCRKKLQNLQNYTKEILNYNMLVETKIFQ